MDLVELERYSDTGRAVLGQRARAWPAAQLDEVVERAMAAQRLRTELVSVLVDLRTPHEAAVAKVRALATSFMDGSWRPWSMVWPEDECG